MADQEKQNQLLREANAAMAEGRDLTEAQAEAVMAANAAMVAMTESSEEQLKYLQKSADKLEQIVERLQQQKKAGVDIGSIYEDQLKAQEAQLEVDMARLAAAKEIDKEAMNANLRRQKAITAEKRGFADSANLVKRMTGISKTPSSLLGKVAANPVSFSKGLIKGVGGAVGGLAVFTSTIDKVVEMTALMATEQDAAIVSFNKATGAQGQFDAQIQASSMSLRTSGVDAGEAAQSFQDLFLNVSDFTLMSKEEQNVLSQTTSILNELGVSSQTTAKNIQLATKVLGMSVNQADELVRGFKTFAEDLGVSTAQLSEDFSRMGPMVAELGVAGVAAFKDLARESKATGVDIERLYQITSNFDTFEGASKAVGGLNAVLGGPFLNTMEMINEENPAERMRMLKDAVDDAGLSFDSMSKFQKKAVAAQMGLNNANELGLVLRGREDLLPGAKESAEDIVALAEQTKEFNTIMSELKQLGMAFAINLGPLLGALKDVVDFAGKAVGALSSLGLIDPVANLAARTESLGAAGIAQTTAATGIGSASAMAESNRSLMASMPSGQGDVYLDSDKIGRHVDKRAKKAVGEFATNRYA